MEPHAKVHQERPHPAAAVRELRKGRERKVWRAASGQPQGTAAGAAKQALTVTSTSSSYSCRRATPENATPGNAITVRTHVSAIIQGRRGTMGSSATHHAGLHNGWHTRGEQHERG